MSKSGSDFGLATLDFGLIGWFRRRDSNPHCLVPKTSASCLLGYAGKEVQSRGSKVQRQVHQLWTLDVRTLDIGELAEGTGFEPASEISP